MPLPLATLSLALLLTLAIARLLAGLLTLARNLGQLTGAAGLGALFAGLAGGGDLAVASASELHFAMQASFALSGVLLLAALWLAGRDQCSTTDDATRAGCESGGG